MPQNTNFPIAGTTKVTSLWHSAHALADEGSFFIASNPTVGTAVAMTVANANSGSSNVTAAALTAGANVTGLPTATSRMVSHGLVQTSIPLAGSTWIWTFGDVGATTNFGYASVINSITIPAAPVIVAPGWSFQLELWATALAAAPTFEVEVGYVERFSGQ